MADDPVAHETAIAAAQHAQALRVDGRVFFQNHIHKLHQIFVINGTIPAADVGKGVAPPAGSGGVAEHDKAAVRSHGLHLVEEAGAEGSPGTAVDIQRRRPFFCRVVVHGFEHPALNGVALFVHKGNRLRRGHIFVFQGCGIVFGQLFLPSALQIQLVDLLQVVAGKAHCQRRAISQIEKVDAAVFACEALGRLARPPHIDGAVVGIIAHIIQRIAHCFHLDAAAIPAVAARVAAEIKMKAVGDALYYVSNYAHDSAINVWRPGQPAQRLTGEDCSVDFFDLRDGTALTVGFAGNDLQEVYKLDLESGRQKKLTKYNAAALKNKYVATPEPVSFVNKEGNTIEGWVLKPMDYDPAKKWPAALDIHGGPRATFGTCFFHQMQTMASDGCFVMFCNPTGSGGRGDAFADISGRYGTIDYEDLMQFVDVVLEKYPAIDPKRLGVLGGSYGGFMCNWIIGHNQRFAAAASQRSIASWITLFGTCDIGLSFDLREVQATPFTDMYKMWDQSPMKFANRAKTPTLFINSTEDYRCWMPEGISMFTALQLNNVPTRMCIFKGENHELSRSGKPRHRVRRLREIRQWLYHYIME